MPTSTKNTRFLALRPPRTSKNKVFRYETTQNLVKCEVFVSRPSPNKTPAPKVSYPQKLLDADCPPLGLSPGHACDALIDWQGGAAYHEPRGNSNQQLIVNHNVLAPAPIQIGSAYILLFVVEVQQHHAMRTFVSGATGPDKICRRTLSGWATMFASE